MTESHLEQAHAQLRAGDPQLAAMHAQLSIAESLAKLVTILARTDLPPRKPDIDLDLLMCNCGHAASRHHMVIGIDGCATAGTPPAGITWSSVSMA